MRGDVRLQRKAAEQRLAEGMDGLDAEAARRIQHLGEKGAGAVALFVVRLSAQQLDAICVFGGGTGRLTQFNLEVVVTANADQSVWYWDGTYWFGD